MNLNIAPLKFASLNEQNADDAKELILQGFLEHFGFIDESLNPDLRDIPAAYENDVFLTGYYDGELVCTGALVKENGTTARIVRMSVAKQHRGKGFAKTMGKALETEALKRGYNRIVLETNNEWAEAIGLYRRLGFGVVLNNGSCTHMEKILEKEGNAL